MSWPSTAANAAGSPCIADSAEVNSNSSGGLPFTGTPARPIAARTSPG
ncbi:MAG TPA: hypothetical protein VK735_33360 [Pseudonocardia sp.]|nr:hypothetical protein [Pseudonocardia sp.]HTF52359.1 hypothetical protein [Pseudonocardia sp.]